MLFLMIGASGSGKTTCLAELRDLLPGFLLHDYDTVGVPPDATSAWRVQTNDYWLDRALQYQAQGRDMLLASQTPFGEFLSCPSATEIDGIAACLLDCDDEERQRRLSARTETFGPEHYNWAAWHRRHAADPQWEAHIIRDVAPDHPWSRWEHWQADDPRWAIQRIDTTQRTPEQVAVWVHNWVLEQRWLYADGKLPLSGQWWDA